MSHTQDRPERQSQKQPVRAKKQADQHGGKVQEGKKDSVPVGDHGKAIIAGETKKQVERILSGRARSQFRGWFLDMHQVDLQTSCPQAVNQPFHVVAMHFQGDQLMLRGIVVQHRDAENRYFTFLEDLDHPIERGGITVDFNFDSNA